MFAGSCIGVILLVMVLQALRRAAKEYNEYIVRNAISRSTPVQSASVSNVSFAPKSASAVPTELHAQSRAARKIKPTLLQQLIRALLHMLQFGVAYFIMYVPLLPAQSRL